ncbi:MAG TPA: lysoplasmalogenase family protein [Flavobacterium sp.]|nr:lysoplasmalogenase family protein [Flavobacterium sp.]
MTKIYFALAAILVIAEIFESQTLLYIFKPMLIPALMLVYFLASSEKNFLYFVSLFCALISNIFFLSTTRDFLLYGMIAFMIYRILTIIIVLKLISKQSLLPFIIACLPFVFIFSCLINLTMNSLSTSLYPAILNGILISILCGIALSNYVMDDNRSNSWLAISTLLSVVLVYLFMIQKYYFPNNVFQPISALVFSAAHYAFYKFVIEAEKQPINRLNNN